MLTQEEFLKLYDPESRIQRLYVALAGRKKCIYCSAKFPEGLILRLPGVLKQIKSSEWFTGEYLFHLDSTHGFKEDVLDLMLLDICEG